MQSDAVRELVAAAERAVTLIGNLAPQSSVYPELLNRIAVVKAEEKPQTLNPVAGPYYGSCPGTLPSDAPIHQKAGK